MRILDVSEGSSTLTWSQANSLCENIKGKLISLNTEEKWRALADFLSSSSAEKAEGNASSGAVSGAYFFVGLRWKVMMTKTTQMFNDDFAWW